MSLPGLGKIPWFLHIKDVCCRLGKPTLWSNPEEMCPVISRSELVRAYRLHKLADIQGDPALEHLTANFLRSKDEYLIESFLDNIQPTLARKLYIQFRIGTLPLCAFTNK